MEEDTKRSLVVGYGLGLLMVALAAYLELIHAGPWWIAGIAVAGFILILHGHFPKALSIRRIILGVVVLGVAGLLIGVGWNLAQHQPTEEARKVDTLPSPSPTPPIEPGGKKEPEPTAKRGVDHKQKAKKALAKIDPAERVPPDTESNAPPPRAQATPPPVVNNCPNGFCISGGTVTNPIIVNNGPPPAKFVTTPLMVNIPQGNPTIYRSTFRVTVSESAIPALRFTARGVNLTEVECGQFDGESRTYTAPNGKGTCDLSNAYGSNNIFAYYTTAPANQGDISIAVDCSGIRCEP